MIKRSANANILAEYIYVRGSGFTLYNAYLHQQFLISLLKASNTPMQTSNHPYQKNLSLFAELSYCENCGATVGSECDD